MDNKEKIIEITEQILDEAYIHMKKKIQKALNSGAIDIDSWDEKTNPYILPKKIVIAILEDEALQYNGTGTCFEKEIKKDVKNLKLFL
jgi:phage gp36-like protein